MINKGSFILSNKNFIRLIRNSCFNKGKMEVFINLKALEKSKNIVEYFFEKYITIKEEIPLSYKNILVFDYSKQSDHILFKIVKQYIDIDQNRNLKIFIFFNMQGCNNFIFFEQDNMPYSELKFLLKSYVIFSYMLNNFFEEEELVRNVRNYYNIIFDSLNLNICIHLLKKDIFQFNRKFKKEFAFLLNDRNKRKIFIKNIINKEKFLLSINDDFIEEIDRVNVSGNSDEDEKFYLHNIHKICNKNDNLIGFLHIFYFIEEKAKIYDSLRIITKALENSYNAYLIIDRDFKIDFYNKRFVKFFDIKDGNHKIKSLDRSEKIFEIIKYIIKSFQADKKDTFLIKKDMNFYKCKIKLIETLDGRTTHILFIFNDITEEKLIQDKLKYEQKKLEKAQLQLVQRERLASIGELSAGIAHELNNPIGFISNNFNTLKKYFSYLKQYIDFLEENIKISDYDKNLEDKREEFNINFIMEDIDNLFKESEEGIDRVVDIVSNLRKFSRIDLEEKFKQYDIREGLDSTITVAYNNIKYHAEIRKEYEEDLPQAECIPNQINQVFLNIIINAVHAIKSQNRKDKGIIKIKTYADEQYVYCEISDDGPGMPEEIKSKIFNPFFTTKKAGEGTGLGLSISYDIVVNKHNGELICRSEVGKGTTFIIKLPIKRK